MTTKLSPLQCRVIGALLEKEITTPDQYPLSLNALTNACNQKSNREPVLNLSEAEVQNTLDELLQLNLLSEQGLHGSRVNKYKHRFCNTEFGSLKLSPQQLAIICVLLLRGPQTPGELRTRTNRLADFSNVTEVETALDQLQSLNGDELVIKLAREPGKRESRYAHQFDDQEHIVTQHTPEDTNFDGEDRLTKLEQEVASLTDKVNRLEKLISDS